MSTNQAKGDPQLRKVGRGGGGAAVYRASQQQQAKAGGAGGHGGPSSGAPPNLRPVTPSSGGGRRKPNGHSNWQPSNVGNGEAPTHRPAQIPVRPATVFKQPIQPETPQFQFGSVSPAFVVPARTSSAPPNLDEQKREQAQFEAARAGVPNNKVVPLAQQHVEHHLVHHPMQYPMQPQPMQQPVLPHGLVQPGYAPPPKYQPPPQVMASQVTTPMVGPPQMPQQQFQIFQPRSSKAIKIVNPETQEEVRFDNNKRNIVEQPVIPVPRGMVQRSTMYGGGPHLHYSPQSVPMGTPFFPQGSIESQRYAYNIQNQYNPRPPVPVPAPAPAPPLPAPRAPVQTPSTEVATKFGGIPSVVPEVVTRTPTADHSGNRPALPETRVDVPRVDPAATDATTVTRLDTVPQNVTPRVDPQNVATPAPQKATATRVETPVVPVPQVHRVDAVLESPRVDTAVEAVPVTASRVDTSATEVRVDATGPVSQVTTVSRVDATVTTPRSADAVTIPRVDAAVIQDVVEAPGDTVTTIPIVSTVSITSPAEVPATNSSDVSGKDEKQDAGAGQGNIQAQVVEEASSSSSKEVDVVIDRDEKQQDVVLDGTDKGSAPAAGESSIVRQDSVDKKENSPEPGVKLGVTKRKNKKKQLLAKADAAGSTSDLYNAYKSVDEKKEEEKPVEQEEIQEKMVEEVAEVEEEGANEVDDWEEAADLPAPSARKDDHQMRYTRDFLLTFKDQHTELPEDFVFKPELVDCMLNVKREWLKQPPTPGRHQDIRMDIPNIQMGGFRPPMISPNMRFPPPSPMMGMSPYRGSDADRWVHVPQRGLIPSPHLPAIHRAEKKYEVGKIADEEQLKQRQINAILNKLTPQNFDKLFDQVIETGIETAATLTGVISQIFDKAVMEPTFCETYARFCVQLSVTMPEFAGETEKVTFRRVLLNKCQEEFERGKREEEEAGKVEEGEESSPEKREEKRLKARRRMLGNIRFIGELYKNSMLTERIMHECIKTLLGEYQNPDEEDVEALCKLMTTIGQLIDHPKAKAHMDAYFDRISELSNNLKLSSRMRFGLKDVIDLRKNGWQERRKVEGPKKIEEVHRDAAQERAQSSRDSRFSRGSSMRRVPSNSGTPMGGSRMPNRIHQDVRQDIRMEEPYVMPVTVSQRPEEIALVPQGGLGRGRGGAFSGQSSLGDVPAKMHVDYSRRPGTAPSRGGGPYGREEYPSSSRQTFGAAILERPSSAERVGPRPLERSSSDRLAVYSANADRPVTPPTPIATPQPPPALTEDQLKAKSDLAIQEYYSARDVKEAAQCVEELKNPEFHPEMVSRWVVDSFERKEMERDLLVKLLVQLNSLEPCLLTRDHLLQGFETFLVGFEDAVMDFPKAPEYIGGMIGKLVVSNVFQLVDAARLVKEGGSPKGSLLETSDGVDVFACILDSIRREKGEEAMVHSYMSSKLEIEDFMKERGPGMVEAFLTRKNLLCLKPILPAEAYIRDALARDQPAPEILEWLQANASALFSDAAFHRMVMTEILKHSIPAGDIIKNASAKGCTKAYSMLLKKLASGKSKTGGQLQYILAIQLFAHAHNHPPGLMSSLFNDLYLDEVIEEQTFFKWQDDVKDPTPGRAQAIREVGKFLAWLSEAPEEGE